MESIYGTFNGIKCRTRDEFIYRRRGFGEIYSDRLLIEYAEKVTGGWQAAGHKRSFEGYFLSDYAISEPKSSLTEAEYNRLKELQAQARQAAKKADDAREWRLERIEYYADNSVEEVWIDKNGATKRVVKAGAHGDLCF